MLGKKKIGMLLAEFLGTSILTLVVLAVSKSTIGIPYFVSIAAGLVIAAMTLVFGAISGAQFNPAITLGLWSVRRVRTLPAIAYIAMQLLGGFAAYHLYIYFIGQHWENSGKYDAHILVAEAVGTFIFSLAWAAAVYRKFSEGKSAAVVGSGLTLGIMVASIASGGLLNPAVALGVRSWVWGTYVLGPVLGAIIGFNLYNMAFTAAEVEETAPAKTSSSKKK